VSRFRAFLPLREDLSDEDILIKGGAEVEVGCLGCELERERDLLDGEGLAFGRNGINAKTQEIDKDMYIMLGTSGAVERWVVVKLKLKLEALV